VTFARAIVAAVQAVPGVARVSPGRFGEVATDGPRERVSGVRVTPVDDGVGIEVHLCALYADTLVLPELAARVRATIRQTAEGTDARPIKHIDVAFDDVLGDQVPVG
jgi:hypothetical protein